MLRQGGILAGNFASQGGDRVLRREDVGGGEGKISPLPKKERRRGKNKEKNSYWGAT